MSWIKEIEKLQQIKAAEAQQGSQNVPVGGIIKERTAGGFTKTPPEIKTESQSLLLAANRAWGWWKHLQLDEVLVDILNLKITNATLLSPYIFNFDFENTLESLHVVNEAQIKKLGEKNLSKRGVFLNLERSLIYERIISQNSYYLGYHDSPIYETETQIIDVFNFKITPLGLLARNINLGPLTNFSSRADVEKAIERLFSGVVEEIKRQKA